jgi:hypothetical protein
MRLFCWLLLLFLPILAGAEPCAQLPKPSVTLKRLEVAITLNTSYSYRTLTNIGASAAKPGHQVLGLTRGNATLQVASNMPTIQDRSGRWECGSPQVTLSMGFSPITVYVAREFPPGSCAYRAIHEHEMRHVKVYQEHIDKIERELIDWLNTRFATGGPWRGQTGETSARLQRELNERWLPAIQRRLKEVDVAQSLIDTPAEYDRVADACNGEIRRLLRGR